MKILSGSLCNSEPTRRLAHGGHRVRICFKDRTQLPVCYSHDSTVHRRTGNRLPPMCYYTATTVPTPVPHAISLTRFPQNTDSTAAHLPIAGVGSYLHSGAVLNLTCNSDLNWCIWPNSFCISSFCISFSCRSSSSSMLLAVLLSRPSKPEPSFKLLINFSLDYYKKRNIFKQNRD